MEFQPTIPTEAINQLPLSHFPGRIVVVDDEASMREAEQVLLGQHLLGYDTESRPSFTQGVRHGLALVQVATGDVALLFRVQRIPLSEVVQDILASPQVLKIGAALRDDLRAMHRVARFTPGGFVDLQSVVGHWGIGELSVKKMAAIVLGTKVSKAQRLTNWEADSLTALQQDYAAVDAWICREIYLKLRQDDPVKMAEIEQELSRPRPAVLQAKKSHRHGSRRRKKWNTEIHQTVPNQGLNEEGGVAL